MKYGIVAFFICCCCLAGLPAQAAVYSDSSRAIQLLARAEKNTSPQQAITYTLQALVIGVRLNNHGIIARSYRQMGYLYRQERKPQLYELDSLCVYHAGLSGNEALLFDALQFITKDYLNNNQLTRAEKYLSRLDSLIEKTDTTFRKCVSEQIKAFYYRQKFRPVESLAHAKSGLYYAHLLQDKGLTGRSLCQVGDGYLYQMKHDSAATYLFKAIEELKKIQDDEDLARVYGQLGFLFQMTGNFQRAIAYREMSYASFEKAGFPIEAAYVPLLMSDIYFSQRKNDTAFICINKALNVFRKYAYPQGLGLSYSYLGRYYTRMDRKDSADHYTTLAKETLKQYNNPLFSFYAEGYEAINAIESRDLKKGDSLIKKFVSQAGTIAPRDFLEKAADMIAVEGYDAASKKSIKEVLRKGDISQLDSNTLLFNPFTGTLPALDSLITQQQHRTITEIETRYKLKQAQDSARFAHQESQLAKQRLTQRNLILLFSLLLLIIAACILYIQVKNRKRALAEKKRALEDKATIEHLKEELSHQVSAILNRISIHISQVKTHAADKASFHLLEEKVMPMMVLYRMLNENQTETINLQHYFEEICKALKASYDHENKITICIDAPVIMSSKKADRLGRILYELVTNSFKYAFHGQAAGRIEVICSMHNKQYYLSITDSGPGIQPMPNSGTQKGLQLVKKLAYELRATIRQKQDSGAGFEFYFR